MPRPTPAPHALAALPLAIALALAAILPAAPARAAAVIFVKPGGGGDGSSWASPLDLAPALAAATGGDELWLAAGRYTPAPGAGRSATIQLKPGVAVYGGFAGVETARDQRDWAANVVTLSGDLLGNDGPGFAGYGDNSYHVVTGAAGAALDGVTISGGSADGGPSSSADKGGGVFIPRNAGLTLANVVLSANRASGQGGAIYNFGGSLTLADARVGGNAASAGAGIFNEGGSSSLRNVVVSGNSAATIGGGFYQSGAQSTLVNVVLSGNSAGYYGGAISSMSAVVSLTNATVSGNKATLVGGGALYSFNSAIAIRNSIIWGAGDTIYLDETLSSAPAVTYSIVQGGHAGAGNLGADPKFVAAVPAAPSTGGNLRLQLGSPAINAGSNADVGGVDPDGNPRIIGGTVDMGAYEALPAARSIARGGPSPTGADAVAFTVAFNLPVTGVDESDFAVAATGGQVGAAVASVSGGGAVWTVLVSTVAGGLGTIRLDLLDDDTITSAAAGPLGGAGAGNGGLAGAAAYAVDREPPATSILGGPGALSGSASASFGLGGDDGAGSGLGGFACRLDGGAFTPCATPLELAGLGDGPHTLEVRAVDAVGNADPTPASYSWTVDSSAPAVSVGPPSAALTRGEPVRFTVTYTGADSISLAPADVALLATGSAAGAVEVSGDGPYTRTVTIAGLAGDGTLRISLGAGTAGDAAGNRAAAAGPSALATVDTTAPSAGLGPDGLPHPPRDAASHRLTIALRDGSGIDRASLGDGDVVVRGPRGYLAAAALVGAVEAPDGSVLVTVAIPAPGGRWTSDANGVYTVALAGGAVSDRAGNTIAAQELGSFAVALDHLLRLPLLRGP